MARRRPAPLAPFVGPVLAGTVALAWLVHRHEPPWPIVVLGLCATLIAGLAVTLQMLRRQRGAALRLALGMSRRLADRGDRYRALIEDAHDCTLVIDADGTLRYASPSLVALLGRPPAQANGRSLREWVAPDDWPLLDQAIAAGEGGQVALPILLRMLHLDGQWRCVETSLRDLRHRPAVAGIVLNCLDVGEREQARRDLLLARERLSLALDGAQVALWDFDTLRGDVRLSPQWSIWLGRARGETDTTVVELALRAHPEDLPPVRLAMQRVARGESALFECELRMRADDGRWLWVECLGRVVERDGAGRAQRLAGVAIDIGARKQAQAQVAEMAFHDALTDLPNRLLLLDRVTQAIGQAVLHGESLALLLIDLDRFEQVNEALGHEAGDRLLCEVADRLRVPLRHGETLARVGGDKFAVALPSLRGGADQAATMAQCLLRSLSGRVELGGRTLELAASIGIAMFPVDGEDAAALMRSADVALAHAKAAAPGQLQFCDAQMSARARRRLTLEQDLRHAIDRGELRVVYQPLVDVASRRIVGAEALARWTHPGEGEVTPGEFIPLAEASGLIVSLGEWVLGQACVQARRWQVAFEPGFRIAVNLSPCQLQHGALVAGVGAAIAASGLAPGTLELEITESQVVGEDADTLALLCRLKRETGARLAIDDFGTGYAGLVSLRRLPIDKLKIDRAFVRDVATDPIDAALVAGILGVARALALDVTVEGVETEAQFERLASLGCTTMQGYWLDRAMPAAELTERLRAVERVSPARPG